MLKGKYSNNKCKLRCYFSFLTWICAKWDGDAVWLARNESVDFSKISSVRHCKIISKQNLYRQCESILSVMIFVNKIHK